jgi:hypothetical protein
VDVGLNDWLGTRSAAQASGSTHSPREAAGELAPAVAQAGAACMLADCTRFLSTAFHRHPRPVLEDADVPQLAARAPTVLVRRKPPLRAALAPWCQGGACPWVIGACVSFLRRSPRKSCAARRSRTPVLDEAQRRDVLSEARFPSIARC